MPAARLRLIDSHTAGEPTRVLVEGLAPLAGTTMLERLDDLRDRHDALRTAITAEPRASEGTVAAFLTPPERATSVAGVIFANRHGYLGMCGHGTIGTARTLAHLGRISAGTDRFALDTPAGTVYVRALGEGTFEVENVAAYAHALDVELEVAGLGTVRGDVAYGGNWFFLAPVDQPSLAARAALGLQNLPQLAELTECIDRALRTRGVTGAGGAVIDHVELVGPASSGADARVYVRCPDGAYDRSPCGTGTSAKLAVLAARGRLRPGDRWVQESIIGTRFTGRIEAGPREGTVVPFIAGTAYLTGETALLFEAADPFRYGIPAESATHV